jgi:hypothetical protein
LRVWIVAMFHVPEANGRSRECAIIVAESR